MLPFDDASIPPPPLDAQYGYEPRKLERSRVARRIVRIDPLAYWTSVGRSRPIS
jgi:hypothetical protein